LPLEILLSFSYLYYFRTWTLSTLLLDFEVDFAQVPFTDVFTAKGFLSAVRLASHASGT